MRRLWIASAFVPLVALACGQAPGRPPPEGNDDGPVHIGASGAGGGGGSGGEASTSECATAGGLCMTEGPGNICPTQISASCGGTTSDTSETGANTEVCCAGFNEAGAPDAVADVTDFN